MAQIGTIILLDLQFNGSIGTLTIRLSGVRLERVDQFAGEFRPLTHWIWLGKCECQRLDFDLFESHATALATRQIQDMIDDQLIDSVATNVALPHVALTQHFATVSRLYRAAAHS